MKYKEKVAYLKEHGVRAAIEEGYYNAPQAQQLQAAYNMLVDPPVPEHKEVFWFAGATGCGKTFLAEAIASKWPKD